MIRLGDNPTVLEPEIIDWLTRSPCRKLHSSTRVIPHPITFFCQIICSYVKMTLMTMTRISQSVSINFFYCNLQLCPFLLTGNLCPISSMVGTILPSHRPISSSLFYTSLSWADEIAGRRHL